MIIKLPSLVQPTVDTDDRPLWPDGHVEHLCAPIR
jgi:hypothetical protein